MKYLRITNKGEISPHALTLMGASTKRDDSSSIGFFGTGNKYAIAKLLRDHVDVVVFAGLSMIEIDTRPATMGSETFEVMHVNGNPTSITTSMGPQWEMWQAIRELYSNALDAGGATITEADSIEPVVGETHFYIQINGDVRDVLENFNRYFASGRNPIASVAGVDIFEGGTGTIYRHGIRCNEREQPSAFDYGMLDGVTINESRIACYPWEVAAKVWGALLGCNDASMFDRAVTSCENRESLEYCTASSGVTTFSGEISDAVKDYLRITCIASIGMTDLLTEGERLTTRFLPDRLFYYLMTTLGAANMLLPASYAVRGKTVYKLCQSTEQQCATIARCLTVIESSGIEIRYPVHVAEFGKPIILGLADREAGRILIAEKTLAQGDTIIIATILEEWVHLKHEVDDCTRSMQDALCNEFASALLRNARVEQAVAA